MALRRAELVPERFLQELMTGRLETALYKRGGQGGRVLTRSDPSSRVWEARAAKVVDTTGAGDAFACGVLAGLLKNRSLERALQWGIVSASFAIEDRGVEGLLRATPVTARERLVSWFGP